MPDPFSTSASVAGLLSLGLEVLKIVRKDITTLVNAPKEVVQLVEKLEKLNEVLAFILELAEKNETVVGGNPALANLAAADTTKDITSTQATVIAKCTKLVEKLKKHSGELQSGGLHGAKRRLLWFLNKELLQETGVELQRFISLFEQCKSFEAM
jgi:hypothetical protein